MPLLGFLDRRLRRALAGDLVGWFDLSGDAITGWVVDRDDPEYRNFTINVVRADDNAVVVSGRVKDRAEVGWRFDIDANGKISALDVLHERVRVTVTDEQGHWGALRLEGSTQISLIREHMTCLVPPWLEIGFHDGGNSEHFVGRGWSGQERMHRWSTGSESTLTIRAPRTTDACKVEMLLWPFTVSKLLNEQRLEVWTDDKYVTLFGVSRQSFLSFHLPPLDSQLTSTFTLRFRHQDAASPASLGTGNDSRQLAFAFKKIRFMR